MKDNRQELIERLAHARVCLAIASERLKNAIQKHNHEGVVMPASEFRRVLDAVDNSRLRVLALNGELTMLERGVL